MTVTFRWCSTAPFVPVEYHLDVAAVDLATTFSAELGINLPSAAVGAC
jgi:hypothetical protein